MFLISLFLASMTLSQLFTEVQRITAPTASTLSIDISSDSNIMVTGNYDDNTYVFFREDKNFSLNQTIYSKSDVMVTDITSDGKILLVVDYGALIRIF